MPSSSGVRSVTVIRLFVLALGLFNGYLAFTLRRQSEAPERHYTFINDDFRPELDVPGLEDKVSLVAEQTVHYQLNGSDADAEWEMLLPPPVSVVRLGPHFRPFAVSMLHTLHCLDRLRHAIQEKPQTRIGLKHVEHCANYVREAILCGADTRLEPVEPELSLSLEPDAGMDGNINDIKRVCRDWTAVYKEIRNNHQVFVDASVTVPYI